MTGPSAHTTAPAPRQVLATVALFALAAIVIATMGVLAMYTSTTADRSAKRSDELAARIDALTESQKLIVAQLGAETTATGTASAPVGSDKQETSSQSVVPFTRTATESANGVNVAVARFTKVGSGTSSGSSVTIRYGNYLDGAVGYSVAVSRGDVFQGSYYVDESTRTADAKLLRAADVTVYGWGTSNGTVPRHVTTEELAHALARTDAVGKRWRSSWFWIKIGRQGEILAATETPPQ